MGHNTFVSTDCIYMSAAHTMQVQNELARWNVEGARRASRNARIFIGVSVVFGILGIVVTIVGYVFRSKFISQEQLQSSN